MPDAQETCRWCGSPDLLTTECASGPHYARTDCRACGRLQRWEPWPMSGHRAAAFVMPFGCYKGQALAQIGATERGRNYLRWLLRTALKPTIRRAVETFLGGAQETPPGATLT